MFCPSQALQQLYEIIITIVVVLVPFQNRGRHTCRSPTSRWTSEWRGTPWQYSTGTPPDKQKNWIVMLHLVLWILNYLARLKTQLWIRPDRTRPKRVISAMSMILLMTDVHDFLDDQVCVFWYPRWHWWLRCVWCPWRILWNVMSECRYSL